MFDCFFLQIQVERNQKYVCNSDILLLVLIVILDKVAARFSTSLFIGVGL